MGVRDEEEGWVDLRSEMKEEVALEREAELASEVESGGWGFCQSLVIATRVTWERQMKRSNAGND